MSPIDNLSKAEKAQLQRLLIDRNYLPPTNARGRRNDDGIWGTVTADAYRRYLQDQVAESASFAAEIITPAPAKPWWQSRRGQGLLKMGLGFALGVLGNFWEPAANVDSALLLDTLFAHLPTILEALGLGLGTWGAGQTAIGAAQAQAPLTLRAPRPAVVPTRVQPRPSPLSAEPRPQPGATDPFWANRRRNPFLDDA